MHGAPWLDEVVDQVAAGLDPGPGPRGRVATLLGELLAGSSGPWRDRAGRRRGTLCPTGSPVEVRMAPGIAAGYTVAAALDERWYGPRLARERQALATAAAALAPVAEAVAVAAGAALVEACVPDPTAIDPRARAATYLGVTHGADGGPTGVRAYAIVRAVDGLAAGLAATPWGRGLAGVVDAGRPVTPHMAAVQVDADGATIAKAYLRLPRTDPAGALAGVAADVGIAPDTMGDAIGRLGFDAAALGRGALVAVRTPVDGPADLVVHLTARVLGPPATRWALVRHLADAGLVADRVARLDPAAWEVSVVALGIGAGGAVGRVTVYVAPTAPVGHPRG